MWRLFGYGRRAVAMHMRLGTTRIRRRCFPGAGGAHGVRTHTGFPVNWLCRAVTSGVKPTIVRDGSRIGLHRSSAVSALRRSDSLKLLPGRLLSSGRSSTTSLFPDSIDAASCSWVVQSYPHRVSGETHRFEAGPTRASSQSTWPADSLTRVSL